MVAFERAMMPTEKNHQQPAVFHPPFISWRLTVVIIHGIGDGQAVGLLLALQDGSCGLVLRNVSIVGFEVGGNGGGKRSAYIGGGLSRGVTVGDTILAFRTGQILTRLDEQWWW